MDVINEQWKVVKETDVILVDSECPSLRLGVAQVRKYSPEDISIFTVDNDIH